MTKIDRRFKVVAVLASLIAGCSSTTPPIDVSATPGIGQAFIAGRFGFEWNQTALRLAAQINCEGQSTFIEMEKAPEGPPIKLYLIPSGNCVFAGLAPMGGIGDRESTIKFGEGSQPTFEVQPDKIYYLGNLRSAGFYSEAAASESWNYRATWRSMFITLDSSSSSPDAAATLIHEAFPEFAHLEVIAVNPLNKYGQQ